MDAYTLYMYVHQVAIAFWIIASRCIPNHCTIIAFRIIELRCNDSECNDCCWDVMIPNGDMQSPENHNGKETEWKVAMGVTRGKVLRNKWWSLHQCRLWYPSWPCQPCKLRCVYLQRGRHFSINVLYTYVHAEEWYIKGHCQHVVHSWHNI